MENEIKLFKGDCIEIMKTIPDKNIDLILCDLPYGTTASQWDKMLSLQDLWKQYWRLLKHCGSVVLFASGAFVPVVMLSDIDDYKYSWIWVKRNSTNFVHAKNRPLAQYEQILIFSRASMGHRSLLGDNRMKYNPQGLIECNKIIKTGKSQFFNTLIGSRPSHKPEIQRNYTNYPTDILTNFPELPTTQKLHTNQKPVPLLEYLIRTYTNEGDTVLDNCMGSGSTGVACVNTGRKFVGIELNEKYFDIAKKRIESAEKPLF